MSDEQDERAQAWEVATFSRAQREALQRIACRLIVLASAPDASKAQVMAELEEAARQVSNMELKDYRSRLQCPGCLETFTSKATMREHYSGRSLQCADPAAMPGLEQKKDGRWGWSAKAVEYFKGRSAG
ncbi:MAG: hypothetical protein JWM19_916 [Actinomycetia bacterium]|nr:hypothetical protein [Actinomycetes bacterium]